MRGGAAGEAEAAERALASIKPEELLCGKCSAGSGGANCSEHGQVRLVGSLSSPEAWLPICFSSCFTDV